METRKNTFKYAVYIYLHDKAQCKSYSESYNETIEQNISFEQEVKNQNKNINSLLKVLGIEDSKILFDKNNTYQCDLNESEIDFISDILYKLDNKNNNDNDDVHALYKKIKNTNNQKYDGFINLYKKTNNRQKLIQELKFIIDGFVMIAERRYGKESYRYRNFSDQLYIFTQYYQLIWIQKMEDILFNTIPITYDDILNSEVGLLLAEYQTITKRLESEITSITKTKTYEWELLKKSMSNQINSLCESNGYELEMALEHLMELIMEEDPDKGEYLVKSLNNEEIDQNESKKDFQKSQVILKKAYEKLPSTEKLILGKIFQ